jgi:hypothetical protein
MSGLNKGEIGQPLRINVGEDISTATTTIIAEPEVGTAKEFSAIVPAVDVTVGDVTFLANEYAEYTTNNEDDLDYVGRWRMKLKAEFSPTDVRQTNYSKFRVLA